MCFCCLSVPQHTGTHTVVLKASAKWAKGRLPPVFNHCPVYLTGSLSVCMFVYVRACQTHMHTLQWVSVLFADTEKDEPIKYVIQDVLALLLFLPKLGWLCPTMMFLFWFFSVSALLSPICFSLPVKSLSSSFPSSLLWTVNPHPSLLTQLHIPLTESLPLYSFFFTSIPLLYSHLVTDELFVVSLLVQTVPALPQSSPPKKSLNPRGCLCRSFMQLQSSALSHPVPLPDWFSNLSYIGEPVLTPLSQFLFSLSFSIRWHFLIKLATFLLDSSVSVIP